MKEKIVTDDDREAQREAMVADSFANAAKQRFGLFGAPTSTAIGDDGEYKKTKCYKGDDGVIIGPRNFFTGDLKKRGCLRAEESVHDPKFITNATGDPYKVAMPPGLRNYGKDPFLKGGHEANWKYAKEVTHKKTQSFATHEYMVKEPIKRKSKKGADGEVELEPVGFKTRQLLKGRTATSMVIHRDGHFEYQGDDYNAQKKLMNAELKLHHSTMDTMLGDAFKPFSQRCAQPRGKLYNGNFNTLKSILAEDNLPEIPKKAESVAGTKYVVPKPPGALEHDRTFKPGGSKFGKVMQIQDFIGKFPEYICSKPDELTRQPEIDTDQRGWRVTYKGLTRPTPSVALNYRNLKSTYPGVFKK